ncbi:MAG: GNAT family N-acetyltransferase, partial [Chloroflexota bacterium]|nr:GNAT family N-acetyltransferase [Chloroflexota bacterium]
SIGTTIWYKDQLVGSLGCSIDREDRKVEIGYWLDASSQGKGIMTRACRGLINYVFDELRMNKVEIHAAPENKRSRAIPERLGFTQEGIDRQAGWLYDHYIDLVLYGMLASEWKR